MGFKYWYEGVIFAGVFTLIVAIPCVLIAYFGSKMINDLGNFPSKSAEIQSAVCWKVLIIEIVSFVFLAAFYHFFS